MARSSATAVPDDHPPRWATLTEAACYAHVPKSTLRDWISKGHLAAYRMGPQRKSLLHVDLDDLDALRQQVPAAR